MINVFILTFCRNIDFFYGTELIFKTLRVGFPNAKITVVDNASIPEVRTEIELLVKENDCLFEQIPDTDLKHHDFVKNTIRNIAEDKTVNGPLVFLDPDICFWDSCEDFSFDGVLAGRLFGSFNDVVTQTLTMPRLHTSFMWIPDTENLHEEIRKMRVRHFDFEPFLPYSFRLGDAWYRYDTGASLYAAIPDKISCFTEEHLNYYDHIFCGSHLDWLYSRYDTKIQEMMLEIHAHAKEGNLRALKGIWKRQQKIWNESNRLTNNQIKEVELRETKLRKGALC